MLTVWPTTFAMSDINLIEWVGWMPCPKTGATNYIELLGLPEKGCAIKGLVVCNSWESET